MTQTGWGLRCAGQRHRCAHLLRNRCRDVRNTLLVDRDDLFQQGRPFLDSRLRKACESLASSGHGTIDVFLITDCNRGNDLFSRRIDDRQRLLAVGFDPLAVDIKLECIVHAVFSSVVLAIGVDPDLISAHREGSPDAAWMKRFSCRTAFEVRCFPRICLVMAHDVH